MDDFFDQILYSAANEDPEPEIRTLKLNEADKVLCISGSGARALDLLTQSPGEIVSIDLNPLQNHLLELKMAAIKKLSYPAFIKFLGVTTNDARWDTYQTLRSELSEAAHEFWDQEREKVEGGILYCGIWHAYRQKTVQFLHFRKGLLDELFACTDLETQWHIWETRWKTTFWKIAPRIVLSKFVLKSLLDDPGVDLVPDSFSVPDFVLERFDTVVKNHLFRDNPFFHLTFRGAYTAECLPLHLEERSFLTLRKNLHRITVVTERLDQHLLSHPNTYSAFSLSDFASYAPPETYREIWKAVIHAAQDGAKVCERFHMVHYEPDQLFPDNIIRNRALEKEAAEIDYSFLYLFNCCTVQKPSAAR